MAASLASMAAGSLAELVADIADVPLQAHEFRIPLGVPRTAAPGPVWRPFSVSSDEVSSQVGLIRVLRFLQGTVLPHVLAPLPVLVDTNLWYRQLKLVYGREAQRWDGAAALEGLPPLYGVWHAYKQVLYVLYRRLLPLFLFVQRGTLAAGAQWSEKPKLRALEMWIGALLMVPADRRLRVCALRDLLARRVGILETELQRYEAKVDWAKQCLDDATLKAKTLLTRCLRLGRDPQPGIQAGELVTHNQAAWEQALRRRERTREALRLCRLDLAVTDALCDLLLVWAPACFALGWRVRQCHWEHRQAGTGGRARECLEMALLMMLHLEAPSGGQRRARGRSEYVRTLSCALLQWQRWHEDLPACCFSEETNEASLSRLGSAMRQHPDATSTESVMDLYLLVRPGKTGFRKIKPGGVDNQWRRLCLDHVDDLLARTDPAIPAQHRRLVSDVVTYATARRGAVGIEATDRGEEEGPVEARETQQHWPDAWTGPPSLTNISVGPKAIGDLEELLRSTLKLLLRDDHRPRPAVDVEMDALCARRTDEDVAAYQRRWDLVLGRHPSELSTERPPARTNG